MEVKIRTGFNPLDIPHILSNVLENLSVWNLKKCRLVSSYWATEVAPILKKKCKISFKTKDQILSLLNIENLGKLCQTFDISNELNLNSEIIREFFMKFSSIVKSLDLSFHHEYNSEWIQDTFPKLLNLEELCLNGRAYFLHQDTTIGDIDNLFPKLKFIFIYDSSYEPQALTASTIWTQNIFHILLSAPNLERVFFAPFMENRAKTFLEILSSEALVHKYITHLHINHLAASPIVMKSLLMKQFPLKYVHFVLTHNFSREDLCYFLFSVENTLKELTLTFTDGISCSKYHPIQPLGNLTKLSLIGYEGELFISGAWKLQLFVMSLSDGDLLASENSEIEINPKLKDLEIYDSKAKYLPQNLKILYQTFSHLRCLKMNNVDNGILRLVCTHLLMLNEIHICFHMFYGVTSVQIDAGLTGISSYNQNEYLLDCLDDKEINHLRSFPWIGHLKNLKLLELELGHITDYGVVLGISRCKSMQKLILKNCDGVFNDSNQIKMTERSLEAISTQMDLHYLKIDGYHDHFSEQAIETALCNMKGREIYFI